MLRSAVCLTTLLVAAARAFAGAPDEAPPAQRTPSLVAARAAVVDTPEEPVRVVRNDDGSLFVDFGKAAFGSLKIEFPRPQPAMAITVRLGEKCGIDGHVDAAPGGSIAYQEIEVPLAANSTVARVVPAWSPTYDHWIKNPEGLHEVAPFRYAEIRGLPPARFTAPNAEPRIVRLSRHVPFDESAAAFDCSDPAVVEVWDLCKHSIKATSFLGVYVDGNRERVAYEADAYINQLCHYGVDAHYLTGRATLEHLLSHPTWPTEWRQHVPLIAWADFLYSGDDSALRPHYDAIRASLMLERRRPDGLFLGQAKGVPRDIVDWPANERDGYDMKRPVKTVTTAFHARSLEAMARIAGAIGRHDEAKQFAAWRDATARTMRETLFDEQRGFYVDGLDPATGKPSRHASLHANMLPLAFGLVPEADVERVADFVASRGMACSVYGSQYLLDALFDAGRADEAVALLTSTGDRSWLHMTRDVGSTITLEAWDIAYKPNLDWNHAWGAVPANIIPRKLMGIEPLEPGFARVRVRPRLGPLTWASVRHPSPRGPVDLKVRSERGRWEADLSLPKGVVAELLVPASDPGQVHIRVPSGHEPPEARVAGPGECVVEATGGPIHVAIHATERAAIAPRNSPR